MILPIELKSHKNLDVHMKSLQFPKLVLDLYMIYMYLSPTNFQKLWHHHIFNLLYDIYLTQISTCKSGIQN